VLQCHTVSCVAVSYCVLCRSVILCLVSQCRAISGAISEISGAISEIRAISEINISGAISEIRAISEFHRNSATLRFLCLVSQCHTVSCVDFCVLCCSALFL